MVTAVRAGVVALLCWGTVGCGAGEAGRAARHTVRDSAGVQIVENVAPAWNDDSAWRISAEAALTIGTVDGALEDQLYQVRDALRFDDGTILVSNVGTAELRWFDTDGSFVRAVGGEGAGPGEFGRIAGTYRYGTDSLMVFDFGNARFQVFDTHGAFARTFRLQQIAGVPLPVGVFATGHVLAFWMVSDGEMATGASRPTLQYALYSPEGALVDTLFRGPGTEFYAVATGPQRSMSVSMPFAHRAAVAIHGDAFVYGASDHYEIEERGRGGGVQRILRRALPNRPVTDAIVAEQKAEARARRAARGATGPSLFEDLTYPAEMPAHGPLLVDTEGNRWVQYYRFGDEPTRFAVYDATGRWLGDVAAPSGLRITDIGSDYLLGVGRDTLDVEQVLLHTLFKTPIP